VRNWKKPLVVVSGDRDGLVSVSKSTALAQNAPQGRLHIVPNCGHFVNLERPAEFNVILGDVVHSVGDRVNTVP
jgi:pimeloyl-ACP methyl ester carboxylesterase